MEAILIPFFVFSCIFGIFYFYITTRNKERMALIESGQSADLLNREEGNRFIGLKIGIVMVGVALGILCGNLFTNAELLTERVAFPSMVFLFSGLALVVSYAVIERLKKKN